MSDKKELFVENQGKNIRRRVVADKYIPEHKRLDQQPFVVPSRSHEDEDEFVKHHKAMLKANETVKNAPKSLLEQARAGTLPQETRRQIASLANSELSKAQRLLEQDLDRRHANTPPFSGHGEDTLWTHGLSSNEDEDDEGKRINEEPIYADEVEVPAGKHYYATEIPGRVVPLMREMSDEEVREMYSKPKSEPEQPEVEESFPLSNIEVGQYLLVHGGSILQVGDMNSIKEAVMFCNKTYGYSVDDMVVLKRTSLRAGILIDE